MAKVFTSKEIRNLRTALAINALLQNGVNTTTDDQLKLAWHIAVASRRKTTAAITDIELDALRELNAAVVKNPGLAIGMSVLWSAAKGVATVGFVAAGVAVAVITINAVMQSS